MDPVLGAGVWSRRALLQWGGALGLSAVLDRIAPPVARGFAPRPLATPAAPASAASTTIDLTLAKTRFRVRDTTITADTINGTVPGPLLPCRRPSPRSG